MCGLAGEDAFLYSWYYWYFLASLEAGQVAGEDGRGLGRVPWGGEPVSLAVGKGPFLFLLLPGAGLCGGPGGRPWSAGGPARAAGGGPREEDLRFCGQGLLRAEHRPKGPQTLREAKVLCGGFAGRQISESTGASRCHGA